MSAADVDRAHRVAIVNEALVRQYFGGEDPIGRTIRSASERSSASQPA